MRISDWSSDVCASDLKYGATVIKFGATSGVLSEVDSVGAPQYSQAEMDAIVDEAHRWGRKVAAHAHGAEGIKTAVRAGVDSIEPGSIHLGNASCRERVWPYDAISGGAVTLKQKTSETTPADPKTNHTT